MENLKQIKLFISRPGDIVDELGSIELIVNEYNKTLGRQQGYILEILNWKSDTYTQVGEDVQDVINQQMDNRYDILIGIIWLRLGTPTKRDKSGTVEEINRALGNPDKEQLLYFKTESPLDITKLDPNELLKINSFKNELSERGVLFYEYNSISNFESILRIQLANLIFEKLLNKGNSNEINEKEGFIEVDKFQHISNLLDEVDNSGEENYEMDIFSTFESASSHLDLVTRSLNAITEAMTDWTTILNNRTKELNKINFIKDDRLRKSKQETLLNLLAVELTEFAKRISNETPIYSENFQKVGESFFNVIFIAKKYNHQELDMLIDSANNLKVSSEETLENLGLLLKSMFELPPANFKFNKSKREAELIISNLTRVTLEGIRLLDEYLNNPSIK